MGILSILCPFSHFFPQDVFGAFRNFLPYPTCSRRRKATDPVRIRAGFTTREETCTVVTLMSTEPTDKLYPES